MISLSVSFSCDDTRFHKAAGDISSRKGTCPAGVHKNGGPGQTSGGYLAGAQNLKVLVGRLQSMINSLQTGGYAAGGCAHGPPPEKGKENL